MGISRLDALLPDMAVFVRVVDCGSFSAAARQLGLTPSAVSRMVSRLERALDLRLIERSTRQLRLSEAGEGAYQRCVAMVTAAREVVEQAESAHEAPRGLLRVSMPKAFGRRVVHPLMAEFLQRYPEVNVQLMLIDRMLNPVGDEVDLMIQATDQPPPTMVARRLMPVRQVVCASPAYLARYGLPQHPLELAGHDCLYLGEVAGDARWSFRRGDESVSVTVSGRYVCNHSEVRLEGVLNGLGIACLPDFIAADALARGEVIEVLPGWQYVGAYQGTAWLLSLPGSRLTPKSRVFIDYLIEKLRP
ncbi:LysR family transcriptional regulator [Chitinivorax sp. PXF-14]|uniref:LysR family transcriptional regulator n=1 Tax=Chitinivorax sp. PXF-14 TaxID=3230488 RepID=UPI0034662699